METVGMENLNQLMEERLEAVWEELQRKKKNSRRKTKDWTRTSANQERSDWNLSEIPVIFGA